MSALLENHRPVAEYLTQVRAALADLPADEVDELTGGLEADLTESLAENGTPVKVFGMPEAYAAELRSAAGLSPRSRFRRRAGLGRKLMKAADQTRHDARANFSAALEGQPGWSSLQAFAEAIRPGWWAFRAFLAYWYISQLGSQSMDEPLGQDLGLPHSPLTWLAMLGLLVLSVEIGRRRPPALVGLGIVLLNIWLVVLVLLVVPVDLYWGF